MKLQEFYEDQAFDAYEYFGAHEEKDGVMFRTYARGRLKLRCLENLINGRKRK